MNPKFMKMMEKKKESGGEMSDNEKKAKFDAVKSMRDWASGLMGDKLKGLKKVEVASNSPEGLSAGLDKAKEIIGKNPGEDEDSDAGDDHELSDVESGDDRDDSEFSGDGSEDLDHEEPGMDGAHTELHASTSGDGEESEEELDKKLKELMAKKAALSIKRK